VPKSIHRPHRLFVWRPPSQVDLSVICSVQVFPFTLLQFPRVNSPTIYKAFLFYFLQRNNNG
jgi:hypothetical protein